jgi:hypothetical protein
VTPDAGVVIPNVQVETLSLCNAWAERDQSLAWRLDWFFSDIPSSPFMDELAQHNVSRANS